MNNIFDLKDLYKTYFGSSPYYITSTGKSEPIVSGLIPKNENPKGKIHLSKTHQPFNKIGEYGQDIWFPVEFRGSRINKENKIEDFSVSINACTTKVSLSKTVIKTALVERKGTVKEVFNVGDTNFIIKGFLIGKNRTVPDTDMELLKELLESKRMVTMHGGYHEIFLHDYCKIAITSLEFPEVQGGNYWVRPFILECESDYIKDLNFDKINNNGRI
ncbi:hypothetical protein CMT48_07690 [Elizabethkingia anophelis]|nr:hypothetical protein [Elizabethkingia anophelis]